MRECPLWLTVDVDWIPGSDSGLWALLDLAVRLDVSMTAFVTGKFALAYPDAVRAVAEAGHSIGTHGWAHGWDIEENYRTTDLDKQRELLKKATEVLTDIAGTRPLAFRAPRLQVGPGLFCILEEFGYVLDSSIPARRYDGFWGSVDWLQYFTAPLSPYCVDLENPGRPGSSGLLEVPPAAFGVPVIMSTIRRAGLPVALWLARRVAGRSSVLTFYCHPSEFVSPDQQEFPPGLHPRYSRNIGPEWLEVLERFVVEVTEGFGGSTSLPELLANGTGSRH